MDGCGSAFDMHHGWHPLSLYSNVSIAIMEQYVDRQALDCEGIS